MSGCSPDERHTRSIQQKTVLGIDIWAFMIWEDKHGLFLPFLQSYIGGFQDPASVVSFSYFSIHAFVNGHRVRGIHMAVD